MLQFLSSIISDKLQLLKFGRYERFFYCVACRSDYKKIYGARTEAIEKRHMEERHISSAQI
jgi:hypothetical protein